MKLNNENEALSKGNITDSYLEVLRLVKSGMTIQNACTVVNISSTKLYKNMSKEQKQELRFYKATTLIHGTCGHFGTRDFMTLEADDDE